MNKIFIGFLLIINDVSITGDYFSIDILPSFVGYWLLVRGLKELGINSEKCRRMIPWAKMMTVYSTVTFLFAATGFSWKIMYLSALINIIGMAIQIYILFQVIMGISQVEKASGVYLTSGNLKSPYILVCVFGLLARIFTGSMIGIPFSIVSFVVIVVFFVALNKTRKTYKLLG